MGRKQIDNIISFILRQPHPLYAHYGITPRDNLAYRMCQVKEDIYKKELSLDKVKKLVEKLFGPGVVYLSIEGGEPLLREDIVKVVALFSQASIRVRVLTNGL